MSIPKKLELHKKLLDFVNEYASCSQGWDPSNEDDYDDFREGVLDILVEHEKEYGATG